MLRELLNLTQKRVWTTQQLADELHYNPAGVSAALEQLFRLGYLSREAIKADCATNCRDCSGCAHQQSRSAQPPIIYEVRRNSFIY